MAVLLKVKSALSLVDSLNQLLSQKTIDEKAGPTWILEKFPNGTFYTFYSPKEKKEKAWFRFCPDDVRRGFNEVRGTSYNLIFRMHGTNGDKMNKELYSYYHGHFVEFLLNNFVEEIKELSITATEKDIKDLDRFKNYDWR